MKTKIYIILVFQVLGYIVSYSQSQNNLNKANGWNIFKLGSSYSLMEKDLSYFMSIGDMKCYFYTGQCCKSYLNYSISDISLAYTQNKLNKIVLVLESDNYLQAYKSIVTSQKGNYGKPDAVENNENYYATRWLNAKVVLSTELSYKNSKYKLTIYIEDKNILLKQLEY